MIQFKSYKSPVTYHLWGSLIMLSMIFLPLFWVVGGSMKKKNIIKKRRRRITITKDKASSKERILTNIN